MLLHLDYDDRRADNKMKVTFFTKWPYFLLEFVIVTEILLNNSCTSFQTQALLRLQE